MRKSDHLIPQMLLLTTLFCSLSGCGKSDEEYGAQVRRVRELEGELADARSQHSQLEERLSGIQTENTELLGRLDSLGTNLSETQRLLEELRAREAQQQARLATFRQMLERFRSMIDSGRLRVRVVRNRMVIELPDNVLFDSGDSELKETGQAALVEIAGVLRQIEGRQFQVAGHTDNIPIRGRRFASNWELSTARAVTVARFLIEQGLAGERISAAGYADTQPVGPNDTPEERASNRRIEIALVPNLDELPDLSSLSSES